MFLSSPADIAVGGGAAGAGKTFSLLLEPTRHFNNKDFGGIIFRKSSPQIRNEGGLWDTSREIYAHLGGDPHSTVLAWEFPAGSKIKFSHLQNDASVLDYQGAQSPFIGFDELTHFSEYQFFYMLSRNRSTCGVRPYMRATCNPDPESWVARLIDWWIDPESGFPIPERSGVLRYFTRSGGEMVWGATKQEVYDKASHLFDAVESSDIASMIKSFTFIPGRIYDNKILMSKDPNYLGNLMAQNEATRMQLLDGNWKIKIDDDSLFAWNCIEDLFTNEINDKKGKYITCDAARFGKDLCVILTWFGREVINIHVLKKSDSHDIVEVIEEQRRKFLIQKSFVLIDQDGVGGGTMKLGGYVGFSGGNPPVMKDGVKENYANLKTQCYYRCSERVNNGEILISITNENCFVDKTAGSKVKIGQKVTDVRDLIRADLRAIKKHKPDNDGKKQINPKEAQKLALGRSPDFGDTIMMREYFDLKKGLIWM